MTTSSKPKKTVRDKRLDHFAWMANRSFANHKITTNFRNEVEQFEYIRNSDGETVLVSTARLNGSWRCCPPKSFANGFNITHEPGRMIVTGDVGDLIVERANNMISWCRGSVRSIDYFAEKVPQSITTTEYSGDVAKEWFRDEIRDCIEWGHDRDHRLKLIEVYREIEAEGSWDDEHETVNKIYGNALCEGGDFPDLTVFNANFMWCREAVRWFVERIDNSGRLLEAAAT